MIQQRITGPRHQDLRPRIAQDLEKQRVRFARARRQRDAPDRYLYAATAIVGGDRLASRGESKWIRPVDEAAPIRERPQHVVWIVKPARGRVRNGQVENRPSLAPKRLEGGRQSVGRNAGVDTMRPDHGMISIRSMTSPSRIRSITSMPFRTCANTVYS